MRVLFIRHAQSENNALQEKLEGMVKRGEVTQQGAYKQWHSGRSKDADITAKGKHESEMLGLYYSGVLDGEQLVVYTSPMQRTCKTVQPLATRMGLDVRVHPDIYEEGGVYTTDPATMKHTDGPSCCAQDIADAFNYDISLLPSEGPWYKHHAGGLESRDECKDRARRVASWLYSKELHEEVGDKLVILVSHQHFLTFLFSALATVRSDSMFLMGNTETAFATLNPNDKSARFRWIGRGDHLTRYLAPRQGLSLARL